MISLNGSSLEGGGQLVRVALALSAITSTQIRIYNVRANRAPSHNRRSKRIEGGLKESHLAALEWLAEQTDAKVDGAEVGSRDVTFKPRKGIKRPPVAVSDGGVEGEVRKFEIVLKKPGSVWLIFQAVFPYVIFGMKDRRIELVLRGGTNVSKSMSGEYVREVLLPTLKKVGVPVDVKVEVVRRGWAGNVQEVGEVKITIERKSTDGGSCLEAFEVKKRGEIEKVAVSVVASPAETRRRVIERIRDVVKRRLGVETDVHVDDDSGDDRRFYGLLVAQTTNGWRLGRDFLGSGAKLKDSGQLDRLIDGSVKKVVDELETEVKSGGCVDEYMQDQLVIFQALARGSSMVDAGEGRGQGALHTKTVRWVCEEVLGEKVVFGEEGTCESGVWTSEGDAGLTGDIEQLQM